jgi:hypothetical protein
MADKAKKERTPLMIVAVGKRGIGKTHTTLKIIEQYLHGNADRGIKPRKCLILDTSNEFKNIKSIAVSDISKFSVHPKVEARRVSVYNSKGDAKSLDEIASDLEIMMSQFRGGLLLIEDPSRFIGDSMSVDLIGRLCTLRHVDVDLILHYQGVGKAGHPKILMNTNVVRLHLTEDSIERHKTKFQEKCEILMIGEAVVKNSSEYGQKIIRDIRRQNLNWQDKPKLVKQIKEIENKYIRKFVYVNYDTNDISGNFTAEEFRAAIFRYMSENQKETIIVRLKRIGRDGKPLYDKQGAIQATENELFDLYWGNG